MIYAQFYMNGIESGKAIPACGDRAVIVLDGRESRDKQHAIARETARDRCYIGYTLMQGETFNRTRAISDYQPVTLYRGSIRVIPYQVWIHKDTGRQVSKCSASLPGVPAFQKPEYFGWTLETRGYTWELTENGTDTIGLCRAPAKTLSDAERIAREFAELRHLRVLESIEIFQYD